MAPGLPYLYCPAKIYQRCQSSSLSSLPGRLQDPSKKLQLPRVARLVIFSSLSVLDRQILKRSQSIKISISQSLFLFSISSSPFLPLSPLVLSPFLSSPPLSYPSLTPHPQPQGMHTGALLIRAASQITGHFLTHFCRWETYTYTNVAEDTLRTTRNLSFQDIREKGNGPS